MIPSRIAAILLACHGCVIGTSALSLVKIKSGLLCDNDNMDQSPLTPEVRLTTKPGCAHLESTSKRAFQLPPSLSEFWAGKCWPLVPKNVASSMHPNGHHGARFRWQRVGEKILAGKNPVSIVVLGGSMTFGCHAAFPWSHHLQTLFNETGWPKVTVTNLAQPGTTTVHVTKALVEHKKLFQEADLFIIDYAVNDDGLKSPKGEHMWQRWKEEYAEVLAMLIALPQKPAVINMETISRPGVEHELCSPSTETEGMHWDVIRAHNVPTIAYSKAVCNCRRSFWMNRVDEPFDRDANTVLDGDWHHPGSITHELIGQLVFASFALEMDSVCQEGITGADHVESQAMVSEQTKCLTNPLTEYSTTSGSEAAFHPTKILGGGTWEFKEDVPGKPGWIAAASPPGRQQGELVFALRTSVGGWLRLDYLASYEGFGDAVVWLNADSPSPGNQCTLHGHWSSHSSQTQPSFMKVSFADGGFHELHIRPQPGAKFKLLGITSC